MAIVEARLPGSGLRTLISYLIYPLGIGLGIWLHYLLKPLMPLYWATQLPLVAGGLVILALEYLLPYERAWHPKGRDYAQDLSFMLLVQSLLPKALGLAFGLALLQHLPALVPGLSALWPHHWPDGLQMLLMLVSGDFGRYWLHRWFHEVPWLWRFHAVHHSPAILYWNNVSRFHPVDKGIQFLVDTLPFLILGVKPEVFALYYVFYALTGFFQHCNVDVRLGLLNHLISGPELHRWHHSKLIEESNRNYGNKVIFFDTLFGTRYLPPDRRVSELGLYNRNYPQGFLAQLKLPYVPGIDKRDLPVPSSKDLLINFLLGLRMRLTYFSCYAPLRRAAANPKRAQHAALMRILRANRDTEFGRRHGFADIECIEDFQARVPLHDYEALQPYIEQQAACGAPALTAAPPVMYNQTSGTTGTPKFLPILAETLKDLKRSQNIYSYVAWKARPAAFAGKLAGIVSPAIEGHLPTGQPCGSASGHIYQKMPALARAKYILPSELFSLNDYELKYRLILRLLLAEPALSYIGSANPSTFKKLLDLLDAEHDALIDAIAKGNCPDSERLDLGLRKTLAPGLKANPARAEALKQLFARHPHPSLGEIWPGLQLISTWTGGSCRIALEAIRSRIPAQVLVMELGYLSSEFRGTITIDAETGLGLPTLQTNFFEFVATERWERGEPEFLTLDALAEDQAYYIFITTPAGLYRYPMNDIVCVSGRCGRTPTLSFVQKGKGVTNITGEKLYESQLIQAVAEAEASQGLASAFYLALADEQAASYALYYEALSPECAKAQALAATIDAGLCARNLEYKAKRDSARLAPLEVKLLAPGSYEAFKSHCLKLGQREGQFKIVALQYRKDFSFDLDALVQQPQASRP